MSCALLTATDPTYPQKQAFVQIHIIPIGYFAWILPHDIMNEAYLKIINQGRVENEKMVMKFSVNTVLPQA